MIKSTILSIFLLASSCQKKLEEGAESYYTCSMHPQVREKEPTKCPICHMALTKVEKVKKESSKTTWACKDYPLVTSEKKDVCPLDGTPMVRVNSPAMAVVKLAKGQIDHFSPQIFSVKKRKMVKMVRLLGTLRQVEEKESKISARVSGRIEKVFIKHTGAFIKTGEAVIEIYSPQLISAGEEFIMAHRGKNRPIKELLRQSRERLELWGIKDFQLAMWAKKKRVPRSIKIYSNVSGIVHKHRAVVGKYFKEGQNFFELFDLTTLWVEMDVYEQDSILVKVGQRASFSFSALPHRKYKGVIDFVNPILNSASGTVKVRSTIKNSDGLLKPGMVASATVTVEYDGLPLVVPRNAVIDTGKKKVVWKKISGQKYQAVLVETGIESEGYTEIIAGLKENEPIVIEGNFLLDAQAQLFGGYDPEHH